MQMDIGNKRMEQILDAFAKKAAEHLKAEDVINCKPWHECLSGLEVRFISQMIKSGEITEEEFGNLVKPHVHICVAKALGAKRVDITW